MKKIYEKSSGNVFDDIGLPSAEKELLKAKLVVQVFRLIKARGLSQSKASELLGTTRAQISSLMHLRPASISMSRLMHFRAILDRQGATP
ncbi:MAG TPA: XRE family transcriptional regulator [Rhizomicrobium sp.]|nr:XRE family transcriptional regulator [Rhizomicrobium sp.]